MRKQLILALGLSACLTAVGQTKDGGITPQMIQQIEKQNAPTASDRALRNALAANAIDLLAKNQPLPEPWTPISVWKPRNSPSPTRNLPAAVGCSAV